MTERDFFEALKGRYPPREYALVPQVRNGTGFQNRTRTADAIAISLWPSRGIDVNGFEFKDSRSDWLKELNDGAKAEEIGRFCDYWWLVVSDTKICTLDELPKSWGLLRADGGATTLVKQAPRREAIAPTITFLASVLRAAADVVTGEAEIQSRINKAVEAKEAADYQSLKAARDSGRAEVANKLSELQQQVREFEAASGIKISGWHIDGKEVGEAVRFVLDGGLGGIEGKIRKIAAACNEIKGVIAKLE